MRFGSFKAGQTKHAMCLSFRYCVLHTCDSAIASLQGVSEANEKANHIQAQSKISINCHCEARSNEAIHNIESHFLVFRHCEARSNEAIHNIESHFKDSIAKTKGEISDDRLPQPLTRLRNDGGASILESCKDKVADALFFRHCEARSNEAIHNQTYFKDSIAKTSDCNIMDCHENQRFSRNDRGADALVFRHCEQSEAIHNQTYFKDSIVKTKGEISDYRLPQPLTRLRNDAGADALVFRHCEQSEAIHNQTYFKDSIAKTSLCNIMDCHENQRFSRNDAEASILESCKHTGQRLRNES